MALLAVLLLSRQAWADEVTHVAAIREMLTVEHFISSMKSGYFRQMKAHGASDDPKEICRLGLFDDPSILDALAQALVPLVTEQDAHTVVGFYHSGSDQQDLPLSALPAGTRSALVNVTDAFTHNADAMRATVVGQFKSLLAARCPD